MNGKTLYSQALETAYANKTLPPIEDFKKFIDGSGKIDIKVQERELTVPNLVEFKFPLEMNFNYLSEVEIQKYIPMTEYLRANFTQENYPHERVGHRIRAGFYSMGKNYLKEEAEIEISKLAKKYKRNFREATPLEFILCMVHKIVCPDNFVCLGHRWENHIFLWTEYDTGVKLHMFPHKTELGGNREIMLVEDI